MARHFSLQCGSELPWFGFSLVFFLCCSASADDRYWIDTTGGSFQSTSNWSTTSGGASGASVPGTADTAVFDQSGTYQVYFTAAPTTYGLELDRGTVTFSLNDYAYTLTSTGNNEIGRLADQTAHLYLTEGSIEFDSSGDTLEIASAGDSRGYLTMGVAATLGTDAVRPIVYVGDGGQGTLTIEDGADAYMNALVLGYSQDASGTCYVRDLGSTLDISGSIYVGSSGAGSLNISYGGRVNSSASLYTGLSNTGSGSISVSGDGSQLVFGTLYHGDEGNGYLSVTSGGRLASTVAYLGYEATGAGSATVSGAGSTWDASGAIYVAQDGIGELSVENGGEVTSTSGYVGSSAESIGRVSVTGPGSSWTMSQDLRVGQGGSGELEITGGGEVSCGYAYIGGDSTGVGAVNVSGEGSKLNASSSVYVGYNGSGALSVSDAAEVHVQGNLDINDPAGVAAGTLSLDSGSIHVAGDFVNEGNFAFTDGLLQVGGSYLPLSAMGTYTIDGGDSSDLPTLDLVGASWMGNVSLLIVGNQYRGKLMIRQGRTASIADAVYVGALPGSEGTIVVESGGTLTAEGVALGGRGAVYSGGEGVLEINQGGEVYAGDLVLWDDGVVRLDGGTLQVDSLTFQYGGGRVEWTTGEIVFDQTSTTLTPTLASKLLGPEATLGIGQSLGTSAPEQVLNLAAPIHVVGGAIRGGEVNNLSTLSIAAGSVVADSAAVNSGDVLLSNPLVRYGGATLANDGVIRGEGRLVGAFTNNIGGQVEVTAGERMVLEAGVVNSGHISVIGGELQADSVITNSASTGLISARDAILRFGGGVVNDGGIALSNGTVDVYGDIAQNVGGRITVSNGGIVNFYDDVTIDSGAADVQATAVGSTISRVVFFGAYNGGVTGGGDAFIEGDHRPGASPGVVSFSGNVAYGAFSTLEIELGGLDRGAEYDAVAVAGDVTLFGTLDVRLIDGFTPSLGDTFDILDYSSVVGAFGQMVLPGLEAHLRWDTDDLYVTGELSVTLLTCPGDADLDGDVDEADAQALAGHWGQSGGWCQGDFNGDGIVSLPDASILAANWGYGVEQGGESTTVPEPGALVALLGMSWLALLCRRHR